MKHRTTFIICSAIFLLLFVLNDAKNFIANDDIFTVNGDIFDTIKFYLTIPGTIPGYLVILIVYHNLHNYNSYILEIVTILTSSALYGSVAAAIIRKIKSKKSSLLTEEQTNI